MTEKGTLTLRPETPADIPAVNALIRDAFWGYMGPTCDEHYLAHLLRQSPGYVPRLSFVAEADGALAGSVLYSMAAVVTPRGRELPVLNFGPLSVHPRLRYTGVGSALMTHTLEAARQLGYGAIVFFGHPDYYPRLGFKRAGDYGITAKGGAVFDAHMALELIPGYLEPGYFREDAAFAALDDRAAFAAFDAGFPRREPAPMPSAGPLLARLAALGAAQAVAALEARNITTLARFFQFSGREIAAWPGMDGAVREAIDAALAQDGYPPKRWPQ